MTLQHHIQYIQLFSKEKSSIGLTSVPECRGPGPLAQHGPLHGPWVFTGRTPGDDAAILGGTEAMAGAATGGAIEDGHTLCGSTESRTENSAAGSETKRLDIGGDVAACRRESRHAPRPAVLPCGQAEVGEGDREDPRKGQEEEDRGGGGGGGVTDEDGATPHPISLSNR